MANGIPAKRARTMDPPFTGRFVFTVADVGDIGAFTECDGLSVEIEVEEFKEGGQNHFSHRLPGRMKWPNIVLKRGLTDSDNLFEWFSKVSGDGFAGEKNKLSLTHGAISLLDSMAQPIRSWEFDGAFPVKWSGPKFASNSSELAVEELEIAHHGFRPS